MPRPALLLRTEEAWVLALPLLGLILGLGEALFGLPVPGPEGQRLTRFLVNVLLLNTLHIVFTFAMIARLPELQGWVLERTQRRPALFWGVVAICGLLLWSFFLYAGAYFYVQGERAWVATALVVLGIVAPGFHNLWQNRGLSLAYQQTIRLNDQDRARADWATRSEKLLFGVLFGAYSLQLLSFYGWALPWQKEMPSFWMRLFEGGSLDWIQTASFALCLASAAAIILLSWTGPFHAGTRKTLFLGRLLLYPLSAYSYVALMAILATHGIEYWAVYRTMTESSRVGESARRGVHATSALLAVLVLVSILPGYLLPASETPSFWIVALSAAGLAVNYTHYGLDRVLFKMSDPRTRAASGSLLLGAFRAGGKSSSSD
jgi:hypothetical protein